MDRDRYAFGGSIRINKYIQEKASTYVMMLMLVVTVMRRTNDILVVTVECHVTQNEEEGISKIEPETGLH